MIDKPLLLIRTLKHLKLKQLVYQIYYRVKPERSLARYIPKENNIQFNQLQFTIETKITDPVNENLEFSLLNLKHHFVKTIDWNFTGHGRLWNYNLQYFNYLHQHDIPNEIKEDWLEDIGTWLLNGKLKLEPYPVSLRVMNMIRFFSKNNIQNKILERHAYGQLNFLAENLEYHIMGNHLLENGFALMMGGFAFNNVSWQKLSKGILYKELNEQTLKDGAHFELSPMYHQGILFRLLELIDWYRGVADDDMEFANFLNEIAVRMLNWLENITFKNGDIPHFNDSTSGISLSSTELLDFSVKLGLKNRNKNSLSESGYRKFTHQSYECVVDSGSVAATYQPGHSHADIFSFVLYYLNAALIVDTGISTYEKGDRRYHERSTRAHNTIELGNENQFEVWNVFRVGRRANVTIMNETSSSITSKHDGYKKTLNAVHERKFDFSSDHIKIVDLIHSPNHVNAKSYLHFHPDCRIAEKDGIITVNDDVTITFQNSRQTSLEAYNLAMGYNSQREATVSITEFNTSLETLITFVRRA